MNSKRKRTRKKMSVKKKEINRDKLPKAKYLQVILQNFKANNTKVKTAITNNIVVIMVEFTSPFMDKMIIRVNFFIVYKKAIMKIIIRDAL